ncbi:MAG: PilZ domain-containing protein [Thermoanaerobaculia bacterium]
MSRSLRVLAVVDGKELFRKIERRFPAAEIETSRTPSAASAVPMTRLVRYDLILIQCPPPGSSRTEFLKELRRSGSASRGTPHLFLRTRPVCETPGCGQAGDCHNIDSSSRELDCVLAEILGSAERLREKIMIMATAEIDNGMASWLLQTRDVSTHGAFLVTNHRLPLGTILELSLRLPGESQSLRTAARVVRHASPDEKSQGLGVRFVDFPAQARRRLSAFLDRRESSSETASPQNDRGRNGP